MQKIQEFQSCYWDFYYDLLGLLLRFIRTFITIQKF